MLRNQGTQGPELLSDTVGPELTLVCREKMISSTTMTTHIADMKLTGPMQETTAKVKREEKAAEEKERNLERERPRT